MPSGPERPARGRSIALRLTLFYALFFGVATATGGFLLYHLVRTHILAEIDQDLLRQRAEIVGLRAGQEAGALRSEFAASAAGSGHDDIFVRLVDAAGRAELASDMDAWRVDLPRPPAAGMSEGETRFDTIALPDARRLARILTTPAGPGRYLQVGLSLGDSMLFLGHFEHYGLLILGCMLSLGTLAGWALARQAMAGVESVTRAAGRIAGGHFSDRVAVPGHGSEIDRLAETFNRMAAHVQTVMAEMRQVNDHIAHDLRSPLTRIRGLAESAAVQAPPGSEAAELAGSIVEECDRLGRIINTMLEIAEAEAGVQRLALEPVDTGELVRRAVELFEGVAEERRVALACRLAAVPPLRGDRRRLQHALANLVDNALKYTPAGGHVTVTLAAHGERVEIAVRDDGPGIAPEDRPHLFERFYRGDRSRHLPGNGLGLSLARAVARAHGGDIRLESGVGAGSEFVLSLPSAGPARGASLTKP